MRIRTALVIVAVGLMAALPAAQSAPAWRTLFDGKSIDAWRGYKLTTVPDGWKVVDGTLAKDGHSGDLISRDEFGDFELELDWRDIRSRLTARAR